MSYSIALIDHTSKSLSEFETLVQQLDADIKVSLFSDSKVLLSELKNGSLKIDSLLLGHNLSRLDLLVLSDQLVSTYPSIKLIRVINTKDKSSPLVVKDEQSLNYPFVPDEVGSLLQHLKYHLFIERRRKLMVYAVDGYHQLYLRDIAYMDQKANHVVIHQPGQHDIQLENSLDEVVHLLRGEPFIQCSPTALVNMYHITQYSPAFFYILDKKIRIAEDQRLECKALYQQHIDKLRKR